MEKDVNIMDHKQLQARLVQIMEIFTEYCDENNLQYILFGGTLLGAVRHKGFIPWDDDIDIAMPREDYERLHTIIKEKPLKKGYCMESIRLGNSPYPFAKIIDTNTIIINSKSSLHKSLWIDVFPLDGVPEMAKYKRMKRTLRISGFLLENACCMYGSGKSKLRAFVKMFVIAYARIKGAYYYGSKIDELAKRNKIQDCEYVSLVVWGPTNVYWKKDFLYNISYMEFEGRKYKVSSGWDEFLSLAYGDYMKLPPKKDRITHNIEAIYK